MNHHIKMSLPIKPIVGFDQPLFELALDVRDEMNLDLVVVLNNIHTQKSFIGSIGYVITSSAKLLK